MNDGLADLSSRLAGAVRHFWEVRAKQAVGKGKGEKSREKSNRGAVTGGKHLDGFRELVADLLTESGLKHATVYWRKKTELPGWYRPEKNWDLLIVADGRLVAIVEFKSQVGSFGNNTNNRFEEAIGSATDLWAAYSEGAFKPSERPWLGYFVLLEDAPKSNTPVRVKEPHYKVFDEFRGASYAMRYELLLTKLVRSRLYDAACLLLSPGAQGLSGEFREPSIELSFRNFIASLLGRAMAFAQLQQPGPPEHPAIEVGPATESPDA